MVGGWALDEEDTRRLFDWGCTFLDFFPACYLHLVAPNDVVRKNRRIGKTRAVIETARDGDVLRAHPVSVTFLVPGAATVHWRSCLRRACLASVVAHCTHLTKKGSQQKIAKELWGLIRHRFVYSQLGILHHRGPYCGRWSEVKQASVHMSYDVFLVLQSLSLSHPDKRLERLQTCAWAHLPLPFQRAFEKLLGHNFERCFSVVVDDPPNWGPGHYTFVGNKRDFPPVADIARAAAVNDATSSAASPAPAVSSSARSSGTAANTGAMNWGRKRAPKGGIAGQGSVYYEKKKVDER